MPKNINLVENIVVGEHTLIPGNDLTIEAGERANALLKAGINFKLVNNGTTALIRIPGKPRIDYYLTKGTFKLVDERVMKTDLSIEHFVKWFKSSTSNISSGAGRITDYKLRMTTIMVGDPTESDENFKTVIDDLELNEEDIVHFQFYGGYSTKSVEFADFRLSIIYKEYFKDYGF